MTDPQLMLVFNGTIAERFEAFHRANPHVYQTLVRLAREWVNTTGRRKLGIGMLFERSRWDLAIQTNSEDFRLNNSHRSFYSRLIQAQEPDLRDLFELRSSQADGWVDHYLASRRAS